MTQFENSAAGDESQKIVKLRIDGASSAVNTIQDKQTGRGISLVCPFPALECDMPVTFKGKNGEPSVRGTIHRIGVEDDPETGLPRLRLSIRTQEQRDTVITSPPKELLEDAAEVPAEPKEEPPVEKEPQTATTGRDPWTPQRDSWSSLEFDLSEERTGKYEKRRARNRDTSYLSGASYLSEQNGEDPAWVSCSDLPCAEEIVSRARTRRRKKLAGAAIWMGMVLSAGAGIYSLDRAGVIDMTDVKSMVAGITVTAPDEPAAIIEQADLEPQENKAPVDRVVSQGVELEQVVQREEPEALPAAKEEADEGYAATHAELHGGAVKGIEKKETVDVEKQASEDSKPEEVRQDKETKTAQAQEPKAEESRSGVDPNDVTLILPTRWPAEYATAYRVRDPNGVVVDVPGGLVRREGWLESLNDHPMVRSVKALQRETGARFIVYVHGNLPRFITTPEGKGVALRLYYESDDDSKAADEVALLR